MMNPESGEMRSVDNADELKKALFGDDIKSLSSKIESLEKEGFTAKFQTGQILQINGCQFMIENILAGKPGRLMVVAISGKE